MALRVLQVGSHRDSASAIAAHGNPFAKETDQSFQIQKVIGRGARIGLTFTAYRGPTGAAGGADDRPFTHSRRFQAAFRGSLRRIRLVLSLFTLLILPAFASAQSLFDTGFTAMQTLFTGTVAKVASLIAIVVGGYQFAHGEPGAKKARFEDDYVADLIRYRMAHERSIHRMGAAVLPTSFGEFSMIAYGTDFDRESHVALVHGNVACSDKPVLVRMHTPCLAGDVFHASSCECASNIRSSLQRIISEGVGAVIYLHQNSLGFSRETIDSADTLEFHKEDKDQVSPEGQRSTQ
jgi:type IV secretory pathway VirB2 component (pilin)